MTESSNQVVETEPPHWFSYGLGVCWGKEVIPTQQYFLWPFKNIYLLKSVFPPQFPALLANSMGFSITGWEDGLTGGEIESTKN